MHRLPRRLLTPLVLAISLGVSWLAWQHEERNAMQERRAAADFALRANTSRIAQGMAVYEQILRGVQGLFAASAEVEPHAFRAYVEALQLDANFSAIDGIAVLPLVPRAEHDAHLARMRALGFAGYTIRPAGERDFYAPLIQIEPFSAAQRAHYGLDPYANERCRHAMELARDTDTPFITSKIDWLPAQAGAGANAAPSQPGFMMYLPLYQKGAPHDTLQARRAGIVGWVAASFRMERLMAGLYGERGRGVDIRIYDGIELAPAALLYDSSGGTVRAHGTPQMEYIEVGGRTWALAVGADAPHSGRRARLIAATGLCLSLLLTLLTWSLASGRERAYRLATEMTAALRVSEARYRHLAQHDALTDLPNLALFSDRLQQALALARREQSRLAVLFIDLDQFKPVNDAWGHPAGDLLLQAVARRLRETVRASDTVARIGGDEFLLLLPAIHAAQEAQTLAALIRDALAQPFDLGSGVRPAISSSIGIAVYPEHGADAAELMKHADAAMYAAKHGGRNQVRMFEAGLAEKPDRPDTPA